MTVRILRCVQVGFSRIIALQSMWIGPASKFSGNHQHTDRDQSWFERSQLGLVVSYQIVNTHTRRLLELERGECGGCVFLSLALSPSITSYPV